MINNDNLVYIIHAVARFDCAMSLFSSFCWYQVVKLNVIRNVSNYSQVVLMRFIEISNYLQAGKSNYGLSKTFLYSSTRKCLSRIVTMLQCIIYTCKNNYVTL